MSDKKGIEKAIQAWMAMSRVEFRRAYFGTFENIQIDPDERVGHPVYYNDLGQLVYADGKRVLNHE